MFYHIGRLVNTGHGEAALGNYFEKSAGPAAEVEPGGCATIETLHLLADKWPRKYPIVAPFFIVDQGQVLAENGFQVGLTQKFNGCLPKYTAYGIKANES
jgi:hypothetical protein